MLTILFIICMFWIFGKILFFGIKSAWDIFRLLFTLVLLPFVLIGMVLGGLLFLAFPLLLVVGIVFLPISR